MFDHIDSVLVPLIFEFSPSTTMSAAARSVQMMMVPTPLRASLASPDIEFNPLDVMMTSHRPHAYSKHRV